MKTVYTFIIALIISIPAYAQENIVAIREVFAKGQEDQKTASALYNKLSAQSNLPPVMVGYMGASAALMAKHSMNPVNKMKYLRICQNTLDSAVTLDPGSFEIRMLRYVIESKTPGVFLENDHIKEDSGILVEKLLSKDWEINDFHAKIASKLIKYETVDQATASRLSKKYNLDAVAYD